MKSMEQLRLDVPILAEAEDIFEADMVSLPLPGVAKDGKKPIPPVVPWSSPMDGLKKVLETGTKEDQEKFFESLKWFSEETRKKCKTIYIDWKIRQGFKFECATTPKSNTETTTSKTSGDIKPANIEDAQTP